jgi:hypothetical protein
MKRVGPAAMVLSAAILVAGPAVSACVANGTGETLFFTIETSNVGERIGAVLGPGDKLCLPGAHTAVFTAFAARKSVEGCPRLSGPDGRERLLHFLPTDSCRWASHGE